MSSDLDDLRSLESEEAQRRRRQKEGLPPAYEDYRKRDKRAPYDQHDDDGNFDEDKLEDRLEEDFDNALRKAHKERILYRNSSQETSLTKADSIIFTSTANALAVACLKLRPVLRSTDDMAHWIAEEIIELGWKAVSACEARPSTIFLTAAEKSRAGLAFKEVDECLLEALKQNFTSAAYDHRGLLVYELQSYLTRTMALQKSYLLLHTRSGYDYFDKSVEWLAEQVESERARQANAQPEDPAAELE